MYVYGQYKYLNLGDIHAQCGYVAFLVLKDTYVYFFEVASGLIQKAGKKLNHG